MNPRILALGLTAAALIAPSSALADSKGLSAAQSSTNNQRNSGSVVLNPSGGTQVNNNVNNAYSSTYSFGPGISCPTPSLAFSAFGGGSEASSSGYSSNGGSMVAAECIDMILVRLAGSGIVVPRLIHWVPRAPGRLRIE